MATLLCSLLIGNRYAAMVVSGFASREITNNDQQRVIYPEIPSRFADMTASEVGSYYIRIQYCTRISFMASDPDAKHFKNICIKVINV